MTGNTKVWRAPLAGLASVAMIATMGVTALSANALDVAGAGTVTLNAGAGTFAAGGSTKEYKDSGDGAADGKLSKLYDAAHIATPKDSNKVFTGWYTSEEGGEAVGAGDIVATDATLYAHYATTGADDKYKVTFKDAVKYTKGWAFEDSDFQAGFVKASGNDVVVLLKNGDTLADWEYSTERVDSTTYFDGWTDKNGAAADYSAVKGGDVLYAATGLSATYNLPTGTVKSAQRWYDASGKLIAKNVNSVAVKKGTEPTVYYTDANGAQKVTEWNDSNTASDSQTAYRVTVNAKQESTDLTGKYSDNVKYFDSLSAVDLSSFETIEGYAFYGWYQYSNLTGPLDYRTLNEVFAANVDGDGLNTTANVYGKFDDARTDLVKVTFDENWDKGSKSEVTLERSAYFGDSLPTPTRDGYVFQGWNTKADGNNGTTIDKNSKVSDAVSKGRTVTLYAQWRSTVFAELQELINIHNVYTVKDGALVKDEPVLYTNASFAKYQKAIDAVVKKAGLTGTTVKDVNADTGVDYVKYDTSSIRNETAAADYVKTLTAAKAGLVLVPAVEGLFTDVNELTPHYLAIITLAQQGVIRGYADGSFSPATGMTRADFAAYLYRLAGEPDYTVDASDNIFTDVDSSTPHYKEILWAAKNGILKGYADGTFGWSALVNRQDAAAFLYRLAGSPRFDAATDAAKINFTDVDSSTPHYKEIIWAASNGIANGYSDGTFNGSATILRQDAAALLNRAIVADRLK
ncbi:S-layer homology domain-containing protein [Bifidobacterium myosotis]|nr:S-layer homology domain-containing protein [Bifidobacterium myosotis]